jgi:Cu+-exporting ATPase
MTLETVEPPVAARAQYACPCHPEIARNEPENSPICGSALEFQRISVGEENNLELAEMNRRFRASLVLTIPAAIAAMGEMIPGQPLQKRASPRIWTWVERNSALPSSSGAGGHLSFDAGNRS